MDEDGRVRLIRKKVTRDADGREVVEEEITDEFGNKTRVRAKVYRDADGNEIIEEERIDEKGNRVIVKRKKDKFGNETIEEERIDEFGNKVIVKRIKDKSGREVIEEVRIDKDGKKTVTMKIVSKDGTVEETVLDAKGNVISKTVKRPGFTFDDKAVQVGFGLLVANITPEDLEAAIVALGCNQPDAKMIVQAILDYIRRGVPFSIGGDTNSHLNKVKDKHNDNLAALKEQKRREMEELRREREEERLRKLQEIQAQKVEKGGGGESPG